MIFRKDVYTEEYLLKLGLNERQVKAVMYVKERGLPCQGLMGVVVSVVIQVVVFLHD